MLLLFGLVRSAGAAPGWIPHDLTGSHDVASQRFVDLDSDGDLDGLAAARGRILGFYDPHTAQSEAVPLVVEVTDVTVALAPDLDGDGLNDLLYVVDEGSLNRLVWRPADGLGGFGAPVEVWRRDSGSDAYFVDLVVVHDLDGDGDLDIVLEDLELYRLDNLGGGSFGAAVPMNIPSGAVLDLDAADLDGDGDLDLAVAPVVADPLLVVENLGNTFVVRQEIVVSGGPLSARFGDMDGDGDPDLVTGGRAQLRFEIHDNVGGFPLAPPVAVLGSATTLGMQILDADGDGDLDLALRSAIGPVEVQVFDASGGVSSYVAFESVDDGFAVADSDGDAIVDLFGVSETARIQWARGVYGGVGVPSLLTPPTVEEPEQTLAGDLDGDGDVDLLVLGDGELHRLTGEGAGDYSVPRLQRRTDGADLRLADLDGDGDLDQLETLDGAVVFRPNDGAGEFGAAVLVLSLGNADGREAAVADLDGDGRLDIVALADARAAYGADEIHWALQLPDGTFGPTRQAPEMAQDIEDLVVTDVDDDGLDDVVLATGIEELAWLHSAFGILEAGGVLVEDAPITTLGVADLNLDGDEDLLALTEGEVWTLVSQGPASFAVSTLIPGRQSSIVAGDVDGDGLVDIVTVGSSGPVLLHVGSAVGFAPSVEIGALTGSPQVDLVDLDQDGDLDALVWAPSAYGEELVTWFENAPVEIPPDATGTTGDTGMAPPPPTTPPSTPPDPTTDPTTDPSPPSPPEAASCGCVGTPTSGWLWLGLLAGLALRRRVATGQ